ncbi:MAG: hypothetical protein E5Y18_13715, partial [Mesorhizobium sp.]
MNTPAPTRLLINGVVADLSNETLSDGPGNPIDLRPQAFAVLRYLSNNPNRLVTKGELMQSVWAGTAVTDDSLVQCIHEIRRALKDDGHAILKTKSRRGYMLALPEANAAAMPATSRTSNRALQRPLAAFVGSLLIVLAVAAAAGWMLRPLSPGGKPLVAVLPFDVLGEETS